MAIRTTYKYACDLDKGTYEVNLRNALMQADSQADAFRVSVTRNGADVDVDGMNAYGYLYVASNQTTIALAGTVSGNTAEVVLTSDCYAVPGYASLVIQLHDGDVRHSVLKVNMHIERTGSNRVLTGGDVLPTLAELLNKISAMEQATDTANATIATIKADTAAAIKTTNEATAAANTATVELAKTAGVAITPTASGSIVSITDGAERPAVSVISHIEPVQEGEGDPSPDNVRPISGWDSVKAMNTNANLVPYPYYDGVSKTVNGVSYTVNDDRSITVSGTATGYAAFVLVSGGILPKTTLYISTNAVNNTNTALLLDLLDASGANVGSKRVYSYEVINLADYPTAATYNLRVVRDNNDVECSGTFKPAISLGTTATAYEPYQGQTLTADLPETVYGGTLDWGTGVMTVDSRFIEFDGTEIWHMDTIAPWVGENGNGFYAKLPDNNGRRDAVPVCNAYKGYTRSGINTSGENAVCIAGDGGQIEFAKTQFSTVAEWTTNISKLKAAGKPVQAAYKLATPYTIQLTPQQLNTLKGTNNVWSDTGDTDLTYIADTQLYIDNKFSALEAALLSTGANV